MLDDKQLNTLTVTSRRLTASHC